MRQRGRGEMVNRTELALTFSIHLTLALGISAVGGMQTGHAALVTPDQSSQIQTNMEPNFTPSQHLFPHFKPKGSNGIGTTTFGEQPTRIAFSGGLTSSVVRSVDNVQRVCGSVPAEYRISCLGNGLKSVAANMPSNADYRDARATISKAGSNLQKIAKQNIDKKKPVLEPKAAKKWRGKSKFTAVQKSKLKTATAKAAAIIKEAETRLIRSAESSQRRRTHYTQIAKSVGNTRRILRS